MTWATPTTAPLYQVWHYGALQICFYVYVYVQHLPTDIFHICDHTSDFSSELLLNVRIFIFLPVPQDNVHA